MDSNLKIAGDVSREITTHSIGPHRHNPIPGMPVIGNPTPDLKEAFPYQQPTQRDLPLLNL